MPTAMRFSSIAVTSVTELHNSLFLKKKKEKIVRQFCNKKPNIHIRSQSSQFSLILIYLDKIASWRS